MTRVVVVAASAIARAGLEALLNQTGVVEVIGRVAHFGEYSGEDPDAVLLDWDGGADELPQEILETAPDSAIVVLADDPRSHWLADALRSGVRAVLPRRSNPSRIAAAIEAAAAGLIVLQPADLDGLVVSPRPSAMAEPLTSRELEVLGVGRGSKQQSDCSPPRHLGTHREVSRNLDHVEAERRQPDGGGNARNPARPDYDLSLGLYRL